MNQRDCVSIRYIIPVAGASGTRPLPNVDPLLYVGGESTPILCNVLHPLRDVLLANCCKVAVRVVESAGGVAAATQGSKQALWAICAGLVAVFLALTLPTILSST